MKRRPRGRAVLACYTTFICIREGVAHANSNEKEENKKNNGKSWRLFLAGGGSVTVDSAKCLSSGFKCSFALQIPGSFARRAY